MRTRFCPIAMLLLSFVWHVLTDRFGPAHPEGPA
jgi:hypothetical protein